MKYITGIGRVCLRGIDQRLDQSAVLTPPVLLRYATVSAVSAILFIGAGTAHLLGALPRAPDVSRGVQIGGSVVLIICGLVFALGSAYSIIARRRSQRRGDLSANGPGRELPRNPDI
jgi:hypothetical protein